MRRRVLTQALLAAAVAVGVSGAAVFERPRRAETGSYADGVALDADGHLQQLPPGSGASLLPGSRVLTPEPGAGTARTAAALELAQQQRDWLASGWLPRQYRDLVSTALLDIHTLTVDGVPLAASSAKWRYLWPRDGAFVAAALATAGHVEDASTVLQFLQRVQGADGSFQARYLPDGSGTPDDRAPQTDGAGWALWALDRVAGSARPERRALVMAELEQLRQRSTAFLLAQVDNARSLPAASSDYWEHREVLVTLGTAAPVLAGLEAAARLQTRLGDLAGADRSALAAARTREAITQFFGPHGYGRYPGRSHADAASAFLLPPFQPTPLTGSVEAWSESVTTMLRPAGGLAPGAGWAEQNLSWTPQTALYGLAAAATGDHAQARSWLDWLQDHRTPIGALPEKVGATGEPAGPAPLAWTCAIVVLAVAELER